MERAGLRRMSNELNFVFRITYMAVAATVWAQGMPNQRFLRFCQDQIYYVICKLNGQQAICRSEKLF